MTQAAFPSQTAARSPGTAARIFDGRRAAACFSTRVAIRRACDLLGLKPGDEILVPAYNCGSETDALRDAGLQITLFAVDRQCRLDLADIEHKISKTTRALYLIHYFGISHPDAAALRQICDAHGLWLIEDCALNLMSDFPDPVGIHGDVAAFCYYKFFPSDAGGALVINNPDLPDPDPFSRPIPAKMLAKRSLRRLARPLLRSALRRRLRRLKATYTGNSQDDRAGVATSSAPFPDVPPHYYFDPKLRDTAMAPLDRWLLSRYQIAPAIAARQANYQRYLACLSKLPDVTPLFAELPVATCPLNMPVLVKNRDALAAALVKHGIEATPWWAGYNRFHDFSPFKEACYLKDHVLALPLHQGLRTHDIDRISDTLAGMMRNGT